MPIRKSKPTSPGRRFQSHADYKELTRSEPEKSLLEPKPKKAGRNSYGRVTMRHQGGGNKNRYRVSRHAAHQRSPCLSIGSPSRQQLNRRLGADLAPAAAGAFPQTASDDHVARVIRRESAVEDPGEDAFTAGNGLELSP